MRLVQISASGLLLVPPLKASVGTDGYSPMPPFSPLCPQQTGGQTCKGVHYVKRRTRLNRMLALKADGLSATDIAERLGLSASVVRRDLALHNRLARRIKEYWIDNWEKL